MLHLVQLHHFRQGRRVARVEERRLHVVNSPATAYDVALLAIRGSLSVSEVIEKAGVAEILSYDDVYMGASEWKLLPPFDHPEEPARCLVTGTGLTHKASASARQQMHAAGKEIELTDSMLIYQWGLEGGKPKHGEIGVAPEWFYKGLGQVLRAHGETLEILSFADDGGEEAEVAGVYVLDDSGSPWRIGFTPGNEFSDHVMEKKNYLYLAPSKLRTCSIGPELVVGLEFGRISGRVVVERDGCTIWEKSILTGEENMCHTLANLEHHHFKYPFHRRPGDVHIHFFGADVLSFSEGVRLEDGDVTEVSWDGLGRPLRNSIRVDQRKPEPVQVQAIE